MATYTAGVHSRRMALLVMLEFLFLILISHAATTKEPNMTLIELETRLFEKLLKSYNRDVKPLTDGPIEVDMGIYPSTLELDEHEMKMRIRGYMSNTWNDRRLMWNPEEYGDMAKILVSIDKLWRPDIVLYNFAEYNHNPVPVDDAIVLSGGTIFHPSRMVETSVCAVNMAKFPFDTQTCTLLYGSWGHTGKEVNITTRLGGIDMGDFKQNNKWEVLDTSSRVDVKTYSCCVEPYQTLTVTFKLRRKSSYFSHVLILPAILIAVLVPFMFLLPPDSKERITMGTVLFLCTLLQITLIHEILPRQHETVPIIVIYHLLTLVWVTLSIILSIFILNVYNRGPRRRKMPEIVRQVFLRSLRRLVCLGGDAYYPLDEQETVSMRGLDRASESDVIVRQQDNQAIPKAERDMDEVKKHVRSLAIRGAVLEARQEVFAEWQQVALVIDRIMCIFFLLTFLISTITLFA